LQEVNAPQLDERVRRGSTLGQLGGIATDEIWRNTAPKFLEVQNTVAPQIGRARITAQQHDRIALADLHISHAESVDVYMLLLKRERGARHGICQHPKGL
jgi:hypothetical protein